LCCPVLSTFHTTFHILYFEPLEIIATLHMTVGRRRDGYFTFVFRPHEYIVFLIFMQHKSQGMEMRGRNGRLVSTTYATLIMSNFLVFFSYFVVSMRTSTKLIE
jgi:hypothetical protein